MFARERPLGAQEIPQNPNAEDFAEPSRLRGAFAKLLPRLGPRNSFHRSICSIRKDLDHVQVQIPLQLGRRTLANAD